MNVNLTQLWEELEIEGTLQEYFERRIDKEINRIKPMINKAIKTRIITAIESMTTELNSFKGFAKCADTKINAHLLGHEEIPIELEEIKEKQDD